MLFNLSIVNFSFHLLVANTKRRGWSMRSGNPFQQLPDFSLTGLSGLSCPQQLLMPPNFTSTSLQTHKCCYKACANSHRVSLLTMVHLSGSVCRHVEKSLNYTIAFYPSKKNLQLWFCKREDEEIPLMYSTLDACKYHISLGVMKYIQILSQMQQLFEIHCKVQICQ